MVKYKVSAVEYLNTIPFIYGINNSEISNQIELLLDFPSECARKLSKNEVDRILGNTFFIKDLEWKKRFKSEIKKIMDFDKNNKTFFNIIKKYY